ncbi:MAG TPA: site-2 protease family protein [Terriglobales bacterium]|jgi:Zn-dependent protease|nr:site-2 protease family protein [Terriglobales bacterium]
MTLQHVIYVFQAIVFLFAISVHESAHAFTAWRCGDPTAKMLGRVSLNPIRHIDIMGTIVVPAICLFTGFPVIGWAKPTPVDPRNFGHEIRDDILTSIAGPISNFLVATLAVICLILISLSSPQASLIVKAAMLGYPGISNSALVPISVLLYQGMVINVLLGVFNLIPVPPLDGSHVVRHMLSDRVRDIYDRVGIFGLILLLLVGGNLLMAMMSPFIAIFNSLLMRV